MKKRGKCKQPRKHREHPKGSNRHHINPRSRGYGDTNNIVILPNEWHALWHKLFVNLTIDEVHDYIDAVMRPNCQWTAEDLVIILEAIKQEEEDEDYQC